MVDVLICHICQHIIRKGEGYYSLPEGPVCCDCMRKESRLKDSPDSCGTMIRNTSRL